MLKVYERRKKAGRINEETTNGNIHKALLTPDVCVVKTMVICVCN